MPEDQNTLPLKCWGELIVHLEYIQERSANHFRHKENEKKKYYSDFPKRKYLKMYCRKKIKSRKKENRKHERVSTKIGKLCWKI